MTFFLLTAESIRALALALLIGAVAGYLLRVRHGGASRWLATFATALAIVYGSRFVMASLAGPEAYSFMMATQVLQIVGAVVALTALVQFAYRFLVPLDPREMRLALGAGAVVLVGLLVAMGAAFAVLSPVRVGSVGFTISETYWALASGWAAVVLLRKRHRLSLGSLHLPDGVGPERTRRAFSVFAVLAATQTVTSSLLVATGMTWEGWLDGPLWTHLVGPSSFVVFCGLVVAYVHYVPAPTTVLVKLVALALAAILLPMAFVMPVLYTQAPDVTTPVGERTLRFSPEAEGGYTVTSVPFALDSTKGDLLTLGDTDFRQSLFADTTLALPFAFLFAGQAWDSLTVFDDAVVYFEPFQNGGEYLTEDPSPLIALFWSDLDPASGGTVEARMDSARAMLTWRDVPLGATAPGEGRITAQLSLLPDGTVEMTYGGDPEAYDREWILAGLHLGADRLRVQEIDTGLNQSVRVEAGTTVFDPLTVRRQAASHRLLVPVAVTIVGLFGIVLVGFPLLFRSAFRRPLDRLLNGVRRVDAGERDVVVPVETNDEVGRLADHFNAMTRALADAEADLNAHAGTLEARVEHRTAELAVANETLAENAARLEAQARRLRELDELKTRFFANVSHELRTPLTLVLGPIEDALTDNGGDDTLRERLPLMKRNARRLLSLINQLLDLARLDAGGMHLQLQPINLVNFLHPVVQAFAAQAERAGVTLLFDPSLDLLSVEADPDKLEQVVTNVVANALAFTKPGGKVRVRLTERRDATGDWAEIVVQDTGQGISEADLPHIFDRFHQSEGNGTRMHGGSGIGLSLVRELVDLHGGTITVESAEGFGTTFAIRLRLRSAVSPEASAVPRLLEVEMPVEQKGDARSEFGPDGRPTVLIVEDNADVRAYLHSLLSPEYRVVEAADGRAGLEAAREHTPDLVLSDVMMPEMDGVALTRALRSAPGLGDVPVVLLTARADDESRLEGLGTGADAYLVKPFNAEELRVRIENLIAIRRRLRTRYSSEVVLGPREVVVSSAEGVFLEQVREAVEAHMADDTFGVKRLAETVGLSTRQLQRRLRATMNLSPNGYIRMMRLERAAQLLEQQAGTVAEIAYAVGYRDASYFSRQFRQVFGSAPSDYATAHAASG